MSICLTSNTQANDLPIEQTDSSQNINTIPLKTISPNTLQLFVKTISLVRSEFVDSVNDEQLLFGAIDGMLKSIDPYAEFLDEQSYLNVQNFSQGELAGIGLTLNYSAKNERWVVKSISLDSPATSYVEVGDFVHAIDNTQLVKEQSLEDIEQSMQGIAGSIVNLKVSNKGRFEREVKLQRMVTKDSLVSIDVQQSVAVITIPIFQENTKEQIIEALVNLDTPIVGIVIDIRNNPGGMLSSAIEVAGLFSADIEMIKITKKDGTFLTLSTEGPSYFKDLPAVILQNRYSASAAEVLASGLQFNKITSIAGEKSYGKGTIQSIIPIDDNQAIKLTVARYLQPDGKKINGVGVIPDIYFSSAEDLKNQQDKRTIIKELIDNSTNNQFINKPVIDEKINWTSLAVMHVLSTIDTSVKNEHNQRTHVKEIGSQIYNQETLTKSDIKIITLNTDSQNLNDSGKKSLTDKKSYKSWLFKYP